MIDRFGDAFWFATPRTPPLWQRGFFLVNCLVLRCLLASVRSGVVKTFRCTTYRESLMADFDRSASIKRVTTVASDRVTFDAGLSATSVADISCGVVFIHAFWAGSSCIALSQFCASLVRVDPHRKLAFILCDIDDIEPMRHDLYGGDHSGGNGDIAWISNGVVLARHNASRQCDFDTTTQSLLLACGTGA